ncbi:MAG: GntR family transcriptional regulator [Micromonosporaceae bacterium]
MTSPSVNPGSPVPPSQQIAALLRTAITDGRYQPGERLPSIPALTERYGVAKQTVQRAIDQLRLEGTLITKPGSGTYVRGSRRRLAQLARGRYGTARGYHAALPTRYRRRVYAAGPEPAPDLAARAFGVPAGQPLLARRHLLLDGEQPVELGVTWLPHDLYGSPLSQPEPLGRPLYQAVEEATRRRYDAGTDQITARLASPEEAQLLRIRRDTAVLVLLHRARDTHGDTIEVTELCWPGPTSTLVDEYRVPRPAPGQHGDLTPPEPGDDLTLA